MIYFDNAATTGVKPPTVIQAVKFGLEKLSANPGRSGHTSSAMAAESVYKAREKVSEFFGADGPENVVFTMNCTHSANCVLKGILRRGDHVVISSMEHNAVVRPLVKTGFSYSVARVSLTNDNETLKNFADNIKPNTRLVFCTAASNVTGKILPMEKIGKLCKEKSIIFAVDAAQTAGVLPINMKKQNIDFLCVAPHKGLYAPMGTGLLIARKNVLNTVLEGGTGINSLELHQPENLPERLESGTVNLPGILGVSAGIDFVNSKGLEKIYDHELKIIQKIYRGLEKMPEIKLYTPFPTKGDYAPVVVFNVENIPSFKVAEMLSKASVAVRGGFHCAPFAHRQLGTLEHGAVRVSIGIFNNDLQAEQFLNILGSKIFKKY